MSIRKIEHNRRRSAGFSLLEITIVCGLFVLILSISLPYLGRFERTYRLSGDARGLAHQLSLARQRAGTDFTHAQIVLNTSATRNSYTLQVCGNTDCTHASDFAVEGGTQYLSPGISFGFGSSTAAVGWQTTHVQTITTTFNSRGVPIDNGGSATATNAIYLTDDQGNACAISITLSGHAEIYRWAGAWISL